MSSPVFDPAAYVARAEALARVGGWSISYLSPCATAVRPWFKRAGSRPDAPRFYLSAGIHGDEVAGPLAVLEMLERRPDPFIDFDVVIFPLLNPDGAARGCRGNAAELDLNRDYRNAKSSEIAGHIAVLETLGQFAAAMFLHEDFEGVGAYLYEMNETFAPGLGREIVAAMGRHVPIDHRPEIEEVAASGGVLDRHDLIAKHGAMEDRPDWPEAIYLSLHHTRASYTTETPMPQPLATRIAAQIAAVETLLDALRGKSKT